MYCKVRDARIYYKVLGKGLPVIMLHGFSPDHRLMAGCMEPALKKINGLQRIYMDLPGMGKSNAPSWINSTDDMLDAVVAFIYRIIPQQHFLLAGESYGGYLARGIISKMKELVDGLLLICPLVIAQEKQRDNPMMTVCSHDEQFLSTLSSEEAGDFLAMCVIQNEYTYHRYNNEIRAGISIANQDFLQRIMKNYPFSFNVDDPALFWFSKPSLFLAGRQDSCVGYRDLLRIIENYPKATIAVINNAGHNLQIEQPAIFNSLVGEWIQQTLAY